MGSAFLGVVLRSMWSDAPVSADPFALLIWMLMYPMFVSRFLGSTNLFVGIRQPAVVPHGANGGVQRGITPLAHWGVFSMSEAVREENALMSYGFLFPKSLRRCQW